MKKNAFIIITAVACVFVLALAGCSQSGSNSNSNQSNGSSPQQQEEPQKEDPAQKDDPSAGMPNPWSDVKTAAEAAEGAGFEDFIVPEGAEISLGTVEFSSYRCMEGIAEAIDEFPAVEMTVRKGAVEAAVEKGDISGDYGTYSKTWTQNIKGLEVTCFGNEEKKATKTIWSSGKYLYSIVAYGLGGDENYGLSADDLNELINSMQ